MKFAAAILASIAATSAAFNGKSASKLLQSARRLNDADEEENLAFLNDFSVKFQGCHHIKQWNNEANGQDDVRIMTKRLAKFRLCPKDSCSATEAGGCKSGYGEYIVDMDIYLQNYWEAKEQDEEMNCNNLLKSVCEPQCEDNGDDEEYCQYSCMVNLGFEECIEGGDPNNDDEEEQQDMQVEEYFECKQIEVQDDGNNNNNNQNQNGEEIEYFAGPYCSEQGGAIKIGVFTDDQCTEFAGVSLYSLTGVYLKYTDESIIEESCTSCVELAEWQEEEEYDGNNNNNNQEEEEVEPREMCQMLYQTAGKCESYMGDTLGDAINEQACNYMSGIKMVRSDGLLDISESRPSAVATAFIVIFAMAFAAMAFYVWYLRTRLGVKKNSLL